MGKRWNTEEHLIAVEDGSIVRSRSVKVRLDEDSWSKVAIDSIKGVAMGPGGDIDFRKTFGAGREA